MDKVSLHNTESIVRRLCGEGRGIRGGGGGEGGGGSKAVIYNSTMKRFTFTEVIDEDTFDLRAVGKLSAL